MRKRTLKKKLSVLLRWVRIHSVVYINNRFFGVRISTRECVFFVHTKRYSYGFTWDDTYSWDWGRANKG